MVSDSGSKKTSRTGVMDFLNTLDEQMTSAPTLQDALGLEENDLIVMGEAAHYLLQKKDFDSAADAYYFLVTVNPRAHHFWLNLGMAEQGKKRFPDALEAYGMAVVTDPGDPASHIRAAECYVALQQYKLAVDSLSLAIDCMADTGSDKLLKAQTIKLRKSLASKYVGATRQRASEVENE